MDAGERDLPDQGRETAGPGAVLDAVVSYLVQRRRADPAVERLLETLELVDVVRAPVVDAPLHEGELALAVNTLCSAEDRYLAAIGHSLAEGYRSLAWQADDGGYYRPGAQVGDGYRLGNMNATLATGDDVVMGIFFLRPGVDYLDHRHLAPEFYLNLTGPTEWRFDFGRWHELAAGSTLWNEPRRVHAMRTGAAPWLSFWAWFSDIAHPCEVVTVDSSRPRG